METLEMVPTHLQVAKSLLQQVKSRWTATSFSKGQEWELSE